MFWTRARVQSLKQQGVDGIKITGIDRASAEEVSRADDLIPGFPRAESGEPPS